MPLIQPLNYQCKYCNSRMACETVMVPELMYESGKEFPYVVCDQCKSIQIEQIPLDLGSYYRDSYAPHHQKKGIKQWLDYLHARHIYERRNLIGYFFDILRNRDTILNEFSIQKYPKKYRILDIGCGSGDLLKKLYVLGYEDLTGVDPFLKEQEIHWKSVRLERRNIDEIKGEYDVIILNHVLEHTSNPGMVMENLSRLVAKNGHILLSCPIANSEVWHIFGKFWIQLDPPRHLSIPSEEAILNLASKYGLSILHEKFNSTEFQILASKDAKKGIGLLSKKSVYSGGVLNRIKIILSKIIYHQKIKEWNLSHKGDQALFVISKL